jgi:hypothetical protein
MATYVCHAVRTAHALRTNYSIQYVSVKNCYSVQNVSPENGHLLVFHMGNGYQFPVQTVYNNNKFQFQIFNKWRTLVIFIVIKMMTFHPVLVAVMTVTIYI